MGKGKTTKLTIEEKKKKKQQMKQILATLANNKKQFADKVATLTPVTQMSKLNPRHKTQKIRKPRTDSKQEESSSDSEHDRQVIQSKVQQSIAPKPVINIFEQNTFVVEGYDQNKNKDTSKMQIEEKELSLEDIAKKKLGNQLNFQEFGLKALKNKQAEEVQEESEPDQIINNPDLQIPEGHLPLQRKPDIEQFRKQLPIAMKQQEIVETIGHNLVTLVCGETGSGKSTQIPQFLYEKNYLAFGKIAVTQPRRLAAIALAQRVAEEMGNDSVGKLIAYQVRHERVEGDKNWGIKFMTDGILLNEMSSDFLLLKYSVVIIDEAHQRKVNTDLLIGLLSQVIRIRHKMSKQGKCKPLRLVIMSATMRIEDFKNKALFGAMPPVVTVEARMFPVTTFYSKVTPKNYVQQAVKKCVKIHTKLPAGDVLIFLTGREQIIEMGILLEQELERINVDEEMEEEGVDGYHKENEEDPEIPAEQNKALGYQIHHLYSSLPLDKQRQIFLTAPNKRKFIISTNIAETSLTIPNIRYVLDSGHEKYKHFDKIWKWYKGWGSRAMAQQRAGRAGRVSHGYCYRLYSTGVYSNIMPQFPQPEINKIPLESIILQLKSIGIQDILRFPFPTPPPADSLIEAINKLIVLQALDGDTMKASTISDKSTITELGRVLSFIPLQPIYGKMLLMGRAQQVPLHILFCVLSLTVETVIAHSFKHLDYQDIAKDQDQQMEIENDEEEDLVKIQAKKLQMRKKLLGENIKERKNQIADYKRKYSEYFSDGCDIFVSMNIVGQFFKELLIRREQVARKKQKFSLEEETRRISRQKGLLQNAMKQLYRNGEQIIQIYETLTNQKLDYLAYAKPKSHQIALMLDIYLQCYPTQLAHIDSKAKYKTSTQRDIHLHPSSYLYQKTPLFVGYFETFQTSRLYMKFPFVVQNYALLAKYGKVLEVKDYIWDKKVYGLAQGQIYSWMIPPFRVVETTDIRFFYIARFLLEGKIFNSFKALQNYYSAETKIIKPDNLSQKVQRLVNALRTSKVESQQDLMKLFRTNEQFLMDKVQSWINKDRLNKNQFQEVYKKVVKALLRE